MILLGGIVVLGLLFVTGALVLRAVFGPDLDLQGPWDPREPRDFRRQACGQRGCRVDHRAAPRPWVARAPR